MHFDLYCLKNRFFDSHQFFSNVVQVIPFNCCKFDFGTVMFRLVDTFKGMSTNIQLHSLHDENVVVAMVTMSEQ